MPELPLKLLELYCTRFSQVPLLSLDGEGMIRYANPAMLKRLGLTENPQGEPVTHVIDIDLSMPDPLYRDDERNITADMVTAAYTYHGERHTLRGHMLSDGSQIIVIFDIFREHDVEILEQVTKLNLEMSSIARTYSKQAQASHKLAHQDALTRLSNRRHAEELLEDLLGGKPLLQLRSFGVILFDIDDFKSVNDTFGHDAGDQVLKIIAATARQQLRQEDVPSRYGGEEFLVIAHCDTPESLMTIAEKLRSSFEKLIIPAVGRPVTASFGVTMGRTDDTLERITKRADEALYRAKRSGKNCVVYAD